MSKPGNKRARAIFTIASSNYMPYAATLMQSVRRHYPEASRYIVLADACREFPDIDLAATILPCGELAIPLLENLQLWYSITEFNTAIKPFAFRHFFGSRGHAEVCYLDPDIRLFAPMREVFAALQQVNCVLTPHMMKPLQDGKEPSDLAIMKAGVYNLGFLALRDDPEITDFLAWWSDRCFVHCRIDIRGNMFTDQRWMDLAPAFIEKHRILRHPGYNVAYWNLLHRQLRQGADGQWEVNGEPLVFYHFSGIDVGDPGVFSRHQNRFSSLDLGPLAALCAEYRELVRAAGWEQHRSIPYAFGRFANGRPIEDPMRRWLLRAVDDERIDPSQPLRIDADFFDQPDETAAARGVAITRTMYQLWLDRDDLQTVFDIHTPEGLDGYCDWFMAGNAEADGCDRRTVAAAAALHSGGALPPGPATLPPRRRPPWVPVAGEAWTGPAAEAGNLFLTEVAFTVENVHLLLPRQAALLWELRLDLQRQYPLTGLESVHDYMGWVLSGALAERSLDPELLGGGFIELMNRVSRLSLYYNDVPLTEGMLITRGVASGGDRLDDRRRFPADRQGRLAHGLWFAFVAPTLFGWPTALVQPLRRYFAEQTEIAWAGFWLNRGELAIWELRSDLQRRFPLTDPRSCWRFLYWLVVHGLAELKLDLDDFDPRLRPFMAAPSPRFARVPQLLEMVWESRLDLQKEFDITRREGRAGLLAWAEEHLRAAHAGTPVADLYPPPPPTHPPTSAAGMVATAAVHRAALGLTGQWRAATGRGEDIRQAAAALRAVGFSDFVVIDSDRTEALAPDGASLPEGCRVELDTNVVCLNADTAFGDWRLLQRANVAARRSIGFWAWELERLPLYWRHSFSFYDEIWTHAEFGRGAVALEGLRPVRAIRPGVSVPPLRRPPNRAELGLPADATVFLFMFDFHSFASRKNPEGVVQAFLEAFPRGDERVHLLLKTQCGAADAAAWTRLNGLCTDPRIAIRDVVIEREQVIALIHSADAFVSLHRSEGFGRGPAEAMLLGKPVILTDYSATADFATKDCAYLVDYRLKPVAPHEYPGVREDVVVNWAEPDIATAVVHMRHIHEQPEAARTVGLRAREQIERLYGMASAGASMLDALGISIPVDQQGKTTRGERRPTRRKHRPRTELQASEAAADSTATLP